MHRVSLRLTLAAAGLLAVAAWASLPQGWEGARLLAAADDPVALSDMALAKSFSAPVAVREVEAALAAGDAELAQSFVDLAAEQGLGLDSALQARVAGAVADSNSALRIAGRVADGFVFGEPEDVAGLAGTVAGDLLVFGDVRDLLREGGRLARGEEVDPLILSLACVGLAVTAGTYVTVGGGAPARLGISVVKAAGKTGRMTSRMTQALMRPLREMVDMAALKSAFGPGAWLQPAVVVRSARAAVKLEKAQDLVRLAGDLGRVQARAGTRAAFDGLRVAESPKDVARLARLAEAKGGKTRAVLKLLGRGAITLGIGAFHLASWMFWALLNLIAFAAAVKRGGERAALGVIRGRKLRRARLLASAASSG